jgi:hypothetical protein
MFTEIEVDDIINTFCSHLTKTLDDVFYGLVAQIESKCKSHQHAQQPQTLKSLPNELQNHILGFVPRFKSPIAALIKNELLELTQDKRYKPPGFPENSRLSIASGASEERVANDFRYHYFRRFYQINCGDASNPKPPSSKKIPTGKYGVPPKYFSIRKDCMYWSLSSFNVLTY